MKGPAARPGGPGNRVCTKERPARARALRLSPFPIRPSYRLGQLTSETHPDLGTGIKYQYDKHGNRTQVTRNGKTEYYGVDYADKLLWINSFTNDAPSVSQSADYTRYSYDDFGQLIGRDRKQSGSFQSLQFQWDTDGRLRNVLKGSTNVFSALYDDGGQRVRKTDQQTGAGNPHLYSFGLHDGYQDTQNTPGLAQSKVAGGSRNSKVTFGDWLGSTRYLGTADGSKITSGLRYDGYGNLSNLAGNADPTEYQYAGGAGYEREPSGGADLGLDYLEQRYYDRQAGRFISRDPIGYAGGLNLYGYCSSDPVNALDPSGLAEFPNQGTLPGGSGATYRMDFGEQPYPDMHVFWHDKTESVIAWNGKWVPRHHNRPTEKPPMKWRPDLRKVAKDFVKRAKKIVQERDAARAKEKAAKEKAAKKSCDLAGAALKSINGAWNSTKKAAGNWWKEFTAPEPYDDSGQPWFVLPSGGLGAPGAGLRPGSVPIRPGGFRPVFEPIFGL